MNRLDDQHPPGDASRAGGDPGPAR